MKGFMLLCLAAVASAAPQGYNYQVQQSAGQSFQIAPSQQVNYNTQQFNGVANNQQYNGVANTQHYNGVANTQQFNGVAPSIPIHAPAPVVHHQAPALYQAPFNPTPQAFAYRPQAVHRRPVVRRPVKPVVTKSFFIHSAPEETEEDYQDELAELEQQARTHYNVLFIKAPSQTSKATALTLAKNLSNQEKTVVYVLSKKTSAADLHQAIQEAPVQRNTKPDVFFIKYRTPEEALHAQHEIQAQYDTLGGSSTITDEGYAPVSSAIGSLDAPVEEEEQVAEQVQSGVAANGYLPPAQY